MTEYAYLEVDIRDGIAHATMGGRDGGRLPTMSDANEFVRLLAQADGDSDVRVVMLTAAEATLFPAHMDLPGYERALQYEGPIGSGADPNTGRFHPTVPDPLQASLMGRKQIDAFVNSCSKPVVTAINHTVIGGMLSIVLFASDIVIIERQVRLRDAHLTGGIVSASGPFLWPLMMGLSRAKKYVLTGEWMSAEEAERIGLVSEVVDEGRAAARAREYAEHLAALPNGPLRCTKRALNEWVNYFEPAMFAKASLEEFVLLAKPEDDPAQGAAGGGLLDSWTK